LHAGTGTVAQARLAFASVATARLHGGGWQLRFGPAVTWLTGRLGSCALCGRAALASRGWAGGSRALAAPEEGRWVPGCIKAGARSGSPTSPDAGGGVGSQERGFCESGRRMRVHGASTSELVTAPRRDLGGAARGRNGAAMAWTCGLAWIFPMDRKFIQGKPVLSRARF
jgi:hypothetical protein